MGIKLKPNSDIVYVANQTGAAVLPSGVPFEFRAGLTRVYGSHPILKQIPRYFEPVSDAVVFGSDGQRYEASR
jgi:hypothetical protein